MLLFEASMISGDRELVHKLKLQVQTFKIFSPKKHIKVNILKEKKMKLFLGVKEKRCKRKEVQHLNNVELQLSCKVILLTRSLEMEEVECLSMHLHHPCTKH